MILVAACCILAACGRQNLPVHLRIDSRFTPKERELVLSAVQQWNDRTAPVLAEQGPAFIVDGTVDHTFTVDDLGDKVHHTIYRIGPEYGHQFDWLIEKDEKTNQTLIAGHGTLSTVLLFMTVIDYKGTKLGDQILPDITTHELGHMLGLSHYRNRPGIMNPVLDAQHADKVHITQADIDEFCLIYVCK